MSKNCETEYKKWKNTCSFPKFLGKPIYCEQVWTKYIKCQADTPSFPFNNTQTDGDIECVEKYKNIKPIR